MHSQDGKWKNNYRGFLYVISNHKEWAHRNLNVLFPLSKTIRVTCVPDQIDTQTVAEHFKNTIYIETMESKPKSCTKQTLCS